MRALLRIASLFVILLYSQFLYAVDPTLEWKTIEGEHIKVHYAAGSKHIAERTLAIAEAAHQCLTEELDWYPVEKTHVILSDERDSPNGFASPLFFSHTVLFLTPPSSINTLEDFDDWFSTLIFHEYTHIIHLDKVAGTPEALRSVFGRFLLLFPNLFQPAWVLEGLATYKETDTERGIGRGQSTLFASMMREEVANGVQPISHVNLPVNTWPAGATRYLYGVYFMNFIAERYGEKKLKAWIEEYSDNLFPFFINTNASKILGKDLTALWEEYRQWLEQRFRPQIEEIKARGIRSGKQISKQAYRTDSVRVIDRGEGDEVYYVSNSGYKEPHLIALNAKGKRQVLAVLNGEASLDIHPDAGLLLTQNEFCNNYIIYKDIYLYDEVAEKLKRITHCGRYLVASWYPDGQHIIAVHNNAGHFSLVKLDITGKQLQVLWQAGDGEILGQIDVSPDGKKVVASRWQKGSGWNLALFDLKEKSWKHLTTGSNIAAYPQYTSDGNILFSMETEGVYNLHRYNPETGHIEQITNLIGGALQSSQAKVDGAVYYTGYSAQGYAIYKMENPVAFKKPVSVNRDTLKIIQYPVSTHEEKNYNALSTMSPQWWFPDFQISDQRTQLGITTTGADALAIHQYSLTASYDTKLDKPAGNISYAYADRLFLSATKRNEITVDNKGALNRILDRKVASAVLAFPSLRIQKKSNLLFSIVYDKSSDDEVKSTAQPLGEFSEHLLGAAWLYDSTNIAPLSISENDGMNLRLVAEDSDALGSDFSGQVYTLDWRQFIRTGRESVLALRFVQGWGTDGPRVFKLGGEGFNDDAIAIIFGSKRQGVFNQRSYPLRGYKEGESKLRGRRAQLLSAEWRFPLQRIEQGIMSPPVGLMQWSADIFAETGAAWRDSPGKYYSSAGFELNLDINLFYALTLRTRLGYAHGFDHAIGDDRLYLKIGSSF